MKKILTLFTLLIFIQTSFSQINLNLDKSKIKWTGKKITNASHWGSLYFSEAYLLFEDSDLIEGKFIVDMQSLTADSIEGRSKERLENHLKDDDFFGVTVHKEAILEFNSKSQLKNGKYNINGLLTIKGITNPVSFTLEPSNGNYVANLIFDRIKFDVTYRSGSLFENLGDRMILDEVELLVTLIE